MKSDQFRLVVIGAGAVSRAAHVPAAIASPHVNLVAVVDPDTDRAKTLCRQYGINADVAAQAAQLGVSFDGAIIATPNHLHAPIAKSLIEEGIPVLIEKPMATEITAARELVDLANTKSVPIAMGYHTRHSGACRTLKYAIDSEHFGRALKFAHQDGSRGGWSPLSGYNLDVKQAGGGVLVTTGTHFLDRLIWLWGCPTEVSFRDNAEGGPENHCIAHFEFNNKGSNLSGSAIFSKIAALPESTVVQTTDGLLIMPSDAAETITFRPQHDPALEYEVGLPGCGSDPRGLYQRELEDFVTACQTGIQPCADAASGLQSLELLERLYAARTPLQQQPTSDTIAKVQSNV